MTISSTIRKAGPFIGNGTASSFPFTYKVFQASDLEVVRLDQSTNVETVLTLTTDYTVTLNQDQDSNPGGTVVLTAGALATGYTLTMTSDVPNLQPTDLTNQGGFYPEVINDSLDRATIQIQQLQEQTDRSLKLAISSTADATLPPQSPNDLIGWDATGENLINVDPGTLATVAAYATAYCDVFVGNGVTQSWTLTRNPAVLYNLDVSINGSTQEPTRDYTLSGTTFTMTTPPPLGARVVVKYKEGLPNYEGDSQDVRFVPGLAGSTTRSVQSKLRDVVSVTDFGADKTGVADSTAAFLAALSAITASEGTVTVPQGTYVISGSLDLQRNCSLIFAPGTNINYTNATGYVLRVHRGTTVLGNNVRINIINSAWNLYAVLLDGANRFADDEPTLLRDISVNGNDNTKGTGLHLTAENATNFITFVKFYNFTFFRLNYGMTIACGSSGSAGDVNTWHWINANVFDNFNFYDVRTGFTAVGTPSVPAEVAGNFFRDFTFQTVTTGGTAYFYGASNNFFSGYIWDWNYDLGDAIIFEGGAINNQVHTNIGIEAIAGYLTNFCKAFTGYDTGYKEFTNNVAVMGSFFVKGATEIQDTLWMKNATQLQGGYSEAIYRWKIYGTDVLHIEPRSGYQVQIDGQLGVAGNAVPNTDNTYSLGSALNRWTTVYATTGTINTSDEREKVVHEDGIEPAALRAWGKVNYAQFKFKDAIEKKGDGARWHFGLLAQKVKEAFESEGLDAFAYGLLCYDEWQDQYIDIEIEQEYVDENGKTQMRPVKTGERKLIKPAGNQYGIRYEEALALECAYLRSRLNQE